MRRNVDLLTGNGEAVKELNKAYYDWAISHPEATPEELKEKVHELNVEYGYATDPMSEMKQATDDLTASMEEQEAAASKMKEQMSLVSEVVTGKLGESLDSYKDKASDLRNEEQDLRAELQFTLSQGWWPTSEKVMELKDKLAENVDKQKELEEQIYKTTKSMLFEKLSAEMTAGAAALLAQDMGLLDEPTAALIVGTDNIKAGLDKDHDGLISLAEYMAGDMTTQVSNLTATLLENSGHEYSNTFVTNLITREWREVYGETHTVAPGVNKNPYIQGPGFAEGGSFVVPSGASGDSYQMAVSPGELVSVSSANETSALLQELKAINANLAKLQAPQIDMDALSRTVINAVERTQR
jgi:hypothetical protein